MADAVASEALGPRPGIAIVSFWQGIVEIALRAVTTLMAFAAFVATAVELDELSPFSSEVDIVRDLRGASGWILAMAIFTIIFEILMIVIRFLNFGFINLKIQLFLIVNIIFSLLFALAFFCGGVALAKFTNDLEYASDSVLYRAAAAGTVFAFFSLVALGANALWMVLFLVMGWNKEVVEYTLKSAVTK